MQNDKIYVKKAYGKINLYLDVLNKRPDGYHNIRSVMQSVSLCDVLTLKTAPSSQAEIKIECSDKNIKCDKSNLIYKAAQKFLSKCDAECMNYSFYLEKNIPVSAGMAGGSSDAAAALMLMNEAHGCKMTLNELRHIGSEIGADVPFFLYGTDAMLGLGSGTELSPCASVKELYGVFVRHGAKLSTGAAYAALDEKKAGELTLKNADKVLFALEKNDVSALTGAIENDFELISEHFCEVEKELSLLGCKRSFLCGSGPTVCGLFYSETDADKASKSLKYPSFVARIGTESKKYF